MTDYYQAYGTVVALVITGILLVAVAFAVSRMVSPHRSYGQKRTTYESGIDPLGTGWSQMNIRYYLFAFMFVVFDVETLFVFPWANVLGNTEGPQVFMLVVMLIFLFFVSITLPYEYKKGVLKWV